MKSEYSLSLPQKQTLALLSAALKDQVPSAELFSKQTDWKSITALSEVQGILGLVYDRILKLPTEVLPERGLRISMALHLEQLISHNRKQTSRQLSLYHRYATEGFCPILLKGISLARLYPNPALRLLGDIDIYLPKEGDYDRANHWAEIHAEALPSDSIYERAFRYKSVLIENHKYITYFGIARYDNALSQIMSDLNSRDAWLEQMTPEGNYRTLPTELNAVYIFHHILHHFSYLGIGLRQICDWILFMRSYGETMDKALFEHYAETFDLMRPMQLFALMATRELSVDPAIFPFDLPTDAESCHYADMIIRDSFRGGNFGFEHFRDKRFRNVWFRRWFMFRRTTMRSFHIAPIAPEHIRLIPLIAVATRLKLLYRRLFHT